MTQSVVVAKTLKIGDTFTASITVTRTGAPVDLSSVVIASQIKKLDDTLVATLVKSDTDLVNGVFAFRSETVGWPEEVLYWDIQFVEDGDTWSMPTRGVLMLKDVTS